MSNQLQVIEQQPLTVAPALGVQDILAQVRLIQEVMTAVMKDGEHFGKIPGCGDKPTLLQPGAQKLLMTFRLAPEYEIIENDMGKGHREYRVNCTLTSIGSGVRVGQGVGSCSTMEGKFRFRVAPKVVTNRPVPREYWDLRSKDPAAAQLLLGGKGFSTKKDDNGQWMIAEGSSEKVEHDNPADYYNTVLKMAKKRALVDATITATAASDIFTQDLEDMPEVIPGAQKPQGESDQPQSANTVTKSPSATVQSAATGELAWRDVIVTMPRAGMKRDEYLKHPDTVGGLYDGRADKAIRDRLFGLAYEWKCEARVWNGKTYPPTEADKLTRKALDEFLAWHEKQPKDGDKADSTSPADDDVPF